MPYSLPVHSQGRAGHRRSYSNTTGAFTSLGPLPRRRSATSVPPHYPVATPKKPTFHFRQDEVGQNEDDNSSSHDDEDERLHGLPPLRLKMNPNSFNAVPFPRSSPLPSPQLPPTRPSFSRTSSTPTVLLSNGKPLKSSLKSSSSSPNIPFPSQSLVPSIMFPDLHPGYYKPQQHQRASSAPCTPLLQGSSSFGATAVRSSPLSSSPTSPSSSSPPSSQTHSPSSSFHQHTPKNVHFPSQEEGGLATVRLFNRSARPASLSRLGEETETETEGESSGSGLYGNGGWSGKYVGGSTYPFPRVALPTDKEKKSPLNPSSSTQQQKRIPYEIDWSQSSIIPRKTVDVGNENVFFESLKVDSGQTPLHILQGSLLVRNITYQKTVMVRYTIDEWETVNDVSGWYDSGGITQMDGEGWDRFKFSISLGEPLEEEGEEEGLEKKTVWLVGKYGGDSSGGGGGGGGGMAREWWDNNEGKNYKVAFRKVEQQEAEEEEAKEKGYKRGVVVSAPPTYASPTPTSTLTKPKLSAPQISSSFTFPSSAFSGGGQQHHQQDPSQYQQQQQQREREKEKEREQHQAALTQSTLARLKKLNLKNYAAPRGYGYGQQQQQQQAAAATTPTAATATAIPKAVESPPPPALTLTSASPTTTSFVGGSSSGSTPTSGSRSTSPSESPMITPNLRVNTTMEMMMMSSPTLSTASTDTTSVDSTPVQTPTQGDEEYDDKGRKGFGSGGGGEGEEEDEDNKSVGWSLGMENGHFATTVLSHFHTPSTGGSVNGSGVSPPPPPPPASTPTPTPVSSSNSGYPYSSYPYLPSTAMDVKKPSSNVSGGGGGLEMGSSPPFSDLEESVVRGGGGGGGRTRGIYWDWGSAADVILGGGGGGGEGEGKDQVRKKEQQQQQPSSAWMNQPSVGSGSGSGSGLMPPQRKRGLHHHQRGAGLNGSSSSGSGSGSDSKSSSKLTTISSPPSSSAGASPSPVPHLTSDLTNNDDDATSTASSAESTKQKRTPPKLNLTSPVLPAPFIGGGGSGGGGDVQSPYPGSPRRGLVGGIGSGHHHHLSHPPQRNGTGHRHFQSMSSTTSPLSSVSTSGSDDPIYQALVREWCFAQGPGPVVGGISTVTPSVLVSGETTPVVAATGNGNGSSPIED